MLTRIKTVCAVSVFLFLFNSCRKGSGPSWDVDVLAPLVRSTLTINNIIPDTLLKQNPDNSLDIVYRSSLTTFSTANIFSIPDTSLDTTFVSFFSTQLNPGASIFSTSQPLKLALGAAKLTQVNIGHGQMQLTIKSGLKGLTDFTYAIPKMKDAAGVPFIKTFTVPAASATDPGIYTATFDLTGYVVDLTGQTGFSSNVLTTNYSAIVTPLPQGDTLLIQPLDAVQITNKFIGVTPDYAKGYFGQSITKIGPDSSGFSLFRHVTGGTLSLEDIDIRLNIENSIGADARVTIQDLSSINTRKGSTVPLTASIVGSPININRSMDNWGTVTPSTYSFSLTPQNSNIKALIENLPDTLSYRLDMELNPLGNISGNNDFIYTDKLMKTELDMTIPLSLVANDLTLADTLDFKLDTKTGNINSGTLFLYIDNGFPFTADAQLYLMDDDFAITDSLIDSPSVIMAPDLDANFVCAGQTQSVLSIPVSTSRMELLRATRKMFLKIKFNTAGQPGYVKVYSFYKMNVKLVGDFNYTVGKL